MAGSGTDLPGHAPRRAAVSAQHARQRAPLPADRPRTVASPSHDALAAVRAVFQRTQGATSVRDDVLVRRLVALGSVAARAVLAGHGRGLGGAPVDESPGAWLCEPDHVSELALAALAELPELPYATLGAAHWRQSPSARCACPLLTCSGRRRRPRACRCSSTSSACGESSSSARCAPGRRRAAGHPAGRADAVKTLQTPLLAAPVALQRFRCEALSGCVARKP
jgi:hypothetical protein